jgi:hypothetical protein
MTTHDYQHLDLSRIAPGLSASLMIAVGEDDDRDEGDDRFVSLDCDGGDATAHITSTLIAHLGQHFCEFLAPCDGKWGGVHDYTGATKAESGTRVYFRRRDECPCCGQLLTFTPDTADDGFDGAIECGGDGEGLCFGLLAALSDDPAAEWAKLTDGDPDAEPCPDAATLAMYRARYDAFAATL